MPMTLEQTLTAAVVFLFSCLTASNVAWLRKWQAREERHDKAMRTLAADKDVIISTLAQQKDAALDAVGAEKDRVIAFLERLTNFEEHE